MQRHNTPPTKTRVLSKPERGVTNGSLEPKTSSLKELYAELLSRALEGDRGKQNGHLRSRIAMLAATGKTMQVFCTQVFHKPPS
jgi:hypothetical protein